MVAAPTFFVVPSSIVKNVRDENREKVFDAGDAVNLDSYFLRYPDMPSARIIVIKEAVTAGIRPTSSSIGGRICQARDSRVPRPLAEVIIHV